MSGPELAWRAAAAGGDSWRERAASDLADGKALGWFQGRMEFGPRALGNGSRHPSSSFHHYSRPGELDVWRTR